LRDGGANGAAAAFYHVSAVRVAGDRAADDFARVNPLLRAQGVTSREAGARGKFFERHTLFEAIIDERRKRARARKSAGKPARAEIWLAGIHQAATDAGADRDVDENFAVPACAETRFGASGSAHVRFDARREDRREALADGKLEPIDGRVAGNVAVAIDEFGKANADGRRVPAKFVGERNDIFENAAAAALGDSRNFAAIDDRASVEATRPAAILVPPTSMPSAFIKGSDRH
jgi:hypothetical protein